VIASHNPGKVREIADLLTPFGAAIVSAAELGLPEPEETGDSFRENAELKARAAANAANLPALADDSGLVVAALGGAPGIHSARWAGGARDFSAAMRRVEDGLAEAGAEAGAETGAERRAAHFACVLSLCWPDNHCESFAGAVHGSLIWPPRGSRGFGYDPIFVAKGYQVTFGEMDPHEKHRISHRARAFELLTASCFAGG
jgi:XTP/dITP diphosphohydrolase